MAFDPFCEDCSDAKDEGLVACEAHVEPARDDQGEWVICPDCEGDGKHDPDAFAGGFTQDDFDEDPDFRESYFAGAYDVPCARCDGTGKVHTGHDENGRARDRGYTRAYTRGGLLVNEAGEPLESPRGW